MKTGIKFGTDGWRALVAEEFTFPHVRQVTQAVAAYLKTHRVAGRSLKVIVGYDTRPLGDRFAEVVAEVLAGNGLKVLLTQGPLPTPAISFAIREFRLSGGIAVTASHNPFTYNGLKFKPYYAGPAQPQMTRWIEKRLLQGTIRQLPLAQGLAQKKIRLVDLSGRYLSFLRSYVDWPLLKEARFRVAYDSMLGAGQDLLQRVVSGSHLKVIPVRQAGQLIQSHHRPEPVGEHLKELASLVRKEHCDVGLATDGDADRAGVVGPDGHFISSQETMALLLWHLLEDRGWRGMVVTTVSATNLMEAIAHHYRVPFRRTPVGFKHIARLMRSTNVLFGGEESGGFGFRGCVPERDGLLAGLLVLEMMAMRKKSLSKILEDLRDHFGHWAFRRGDLGLSQPMAPTHLIQWAKKISKMPGISLGVSQVQTLDGVKVIFEDKSWLLMRPSGTEPLLRIYAEARSEKKAGRLIEAGQAIGRQMVRGS